MYLDEMLEKTANAAEPFTAVDANETRLLETYRKIRKPNLHKMMPIPVFKK
jgi:hypothetical protein